MYQTHATHACRFAALALTGQPIDPHDARKVTALLDDISRLVLSMAQKISGLDARTQTEERRAELLAHPVQGMIDQLAVDVARSRPRSTRGYVSPSERWSEHSLAHPGSPTPELWKAVAAHAFLARLALDEHTPAGDLERQWSRLAPVAALTRSLAAAREDLLGPAYSPTTIEARARYRGLDVIARSVLDLAAQPDPGDLGPSPPNGAVMVISHLNQLPVALTNLHTLLTGTTTRAPDLLAIGRALGMASSAAATALSAATEREHDPTLRGILDGTATALSEHGRKLTSVANTYYPWLATLAPASGQPAALAQAREILSAALPRLRSVRGRPESAYQMTPVLLEYAAGIPAATDALASTLTVPAARGHVYLRDRHEENAAPWKRAHLRDLAPVLASFTQAASVVRRAPAPPDRHPSPTRPAHLRDAQAALQDLNDALHDRLRARRPPLPTAGRGALAPGLSR
jgi:hypothetical protein